jgi:hypothetical protein
VRGGGRRTLLESADFARSQGDPDTVDLGPFPELALLWLVVRHWCREDEKILDISTVEAGGGLVGVPSGAGGRTKFGCCGVASVAVRISPGILCVWWC